CLVLADGFYEWQKVGSRKQPHYFHLVDGGPFAFAGLWDVWQGHDGELIESCAILTTEANEVVRPVHERMPVILPTEAYGAWLDPALQESAKLRPLLRPYPAEAIIVCSVSSWVNDARHEGTRCVERV